MQLEFPSRLFILMTSLLVVSVAGCASWKESATPAELFEQRHSTHSEGRNRVVLEVEFVNVAMDPSDPDEIASLWQWVDETAIDTVARRRLIANGIRVGFLANEERFRNRLNKSVTETDVVDDFLTEASIASESSHGSKRIPLRLGRRYEMPLRQPIPGSHVALLRVDGETTGRTLQNAQYLMAITATESAVEEQIRLKVRPEIHFGETRQKWVSSDSAIRIDSRRETWSIPELDIDVKVSERDTIVFAPTTPMVGMAKQMLTGEGAGQGQQQLVVLVRVAQIPSSVDQL